jgi:hypothetical protein
MRFSRSEPTPDSFVTRKMALLASAFKFGNGPTPDLICPCSSAWADRLPRKHEIAERLVCTKARLCWAILSSDAECPKKPNVLSHSVNHHP